MEQFIDREYEMETLESEYRRKGSALVIMYGRRRVGKTTLISEFIKDKNALFFLASEESEAQNRALFKEKAADFITLISCFFKTFFKYRKNAHNYFFLYIYYIIYYSSPILAASSAV